MTAANIRESFEAAQAVVPLPSAFRAYDLQEFIDHPFPPREQMLAPWLPVKGLAMVFAPRGVGKTFFALNVGYAVASGGGFLKWSATKPRKVILLDGEMTGAQLQERLSEIIAHSNHEPAPGYFRLIPFDTFIDGATPDLSTEAGQNLIEPHLADAELLIVDNLSTLCRSGKENEAESWGQIQHWALDQRKKGRSVVFVHHAGKGGEQRGTSRREDVLDTVIRLANPEDYEPSDGARFVVSFTKSRGFHGDQADAFEARLTDGVWSCVESKDILEAQVRALFAEEGMTVRKAADELGVSKSKVQRVRKRLEEQ
jgi:putative DNA primase/helicase